MNDAWPRGRDRPSGRWRLGHLGLEIGADLGRVRGFDELDGLFLGRLRLTTTPAGAETNLRQARHRLASRSMAETRRTCSPITRAASYRDGAWAKPLPWSKSRRRSVMIDWVQERLPLLSRMKTRSPGWAKMCIFRETFT
jgi:hypothetical protein